MCVLNSVNSSSVLVGESDWHRIVWKDEALHVSNLRVESDVRVESLSLQGVINELYLEDLLEDSVYNDGKSTIMCIFILCPYFTLSCTLF